MAAGTCDPPHLPWLNDMYFMSCGYKSDAVPLMRSKSCSKGPVSSLYHTMLLEVNGTGRQDSAVNCEECFLFRAFPKDGVTITSPRLPQLVVFANLPKGGALVLGNYRLWGFQAGFGFGVTSA